MYKQFIKKLTETLTAYHYYKNGKDLSIEDFLLWLNSINMIK